jgi:chromosome segregation ATPase
VSAEKTGILARIFGLNRHLLEFKQKELGRLMNDTLSLNKLEKLIELETQLREEYQQKLDAKDTAIAELNQDKTAIEAKVAELEKTISTQLTTIKDMSGKSSDTQALEQRNRELHNRSENMKEEVTAAKSRIKALQKDLTAERAELAELKKYDPQRLRKNLDASKKKLAEKTTAADKLQKSLSQVRSENSQLELKIKELESQLEKEQDDKIDSVEEGQEAA